MAEAHWCWCTDVGVRNTSLSAIAHGVGLSVLWVGCQLLADATPGTPRQAAITGSDEEVDVSDVSPR